jgi:hypothetical protein
MLSFQLEPPVGKSNQIAGGYGRCLSLKRLDWDV